MTISFILNGEDIIHTAPSNHTLLSVLQGHFSLSPHHSPCQKASCQRCLVLLDNRLVNSCRVPFYMVRRKEVITLEGWKLTEDYQHLKEFLDTQEVSPCPSCTDTRLFTFHGAQDQLDPQSPEGILALMQEIPCRCGSAEPTAQALELYLRKKESGHVVRR